MLLDDIRIATPCDASWDEMPGDDRVRSCSACSRSVYNIAAMTSAEVAALIAGREGRVCGRIFRRADGTVLTSDCGAESAPAAPRRRRRVVGLTLVLAALAVACVVSERRESRPSGPGVTWDDWVHWASVSLGLRPAPPPPNVFVAPPAMGDMY